MVQLGSIWEASLHEKPCQGKNDSAILELMAERETEREREREPIILENALPTCPWQVNMLRRMRMIGVHWLTGYVLSATASGTSPMSLGMELGRSFGSR